MPPARTGPPPLLERLYGAGRVVPLQQLLLHLSSLSSNAAQLRDTLVTPMDHPDYAVGLLSKTLCVVTPGAPPLREGFSLQQASSQMQLIHRAIEGLLSAQQRADNVLCYGCRKKRPSLSGQQLAGTSSTESFRHNSIAASLEAPAWQLLLSRIGDTLMLYLLLHVTMLTRLPNNCCLQLTGPPIGQVARNWRYKAAEGTAVAAAAALVEALPPAAPAPAPSVAATQGGPLRAPASLDSRRRRARRDSDGSAAPSSDARCAGEPTQPAPPTRESPSNAQAVAAAEAAARVPSRKRKQRPSSWQRKKAAVARHAAAVEAAPGGMEVDGALPRDDDVPPTQPLEDAGAEDAGRTEPAGVAPPLRAPGLHHHDHDHGGRWSPRLPRPSTTPLERTPIFYCATFSPKPGFPAKHIFNVVKGRADAGRVLYASIFTANTTPSGRRGRGAAPAPTTVPQPARRVPASRRHVLSLLQCLAQRAAKCPFGVLLNVHCPLPPSLKRPAHAPAAADAGDAADAVAQGAPGAAASSAPGRDLDALMDELFDMEQRRTGGQENQRGGLQVCRGVLAQGDDQAHPGGSSGSGSDGRRRHKQSGLHRLIAAAGSSLHAAQPTPGATSAAPQDSVHGRGGGGSGRRPSADAAQRGSLRSGLVESPELDAMDAAVGVPSTQPLPEEVELPSFVPGVDGSRAPLSSQPAGSGAAQPSVQGPPSGAEALAACFVPHARVCGFVWGAVRRLVPPALLGSQRSQRALHRAIRRFISLRRFEQMTVHQAMQGLPISGLPWLQPQQAEQANQGEQAQQARQQHARGVPRSLAAAQQRQLSLWLAWLFDVVVVPLLRAHFYCTESEAYRQQVFYYRKPVWAALAARELGRLREAQFTPLAAGEAQEILQARRLGVAKLRLLPKRVGLRAIINLGARSTVVFRGPRRTPRAGVPRARSSTTTLTFKPVNEMLGSVYQILKLEASRHVGLTGASVFGYNDAYCRLQPFVRRWRAAAAAAASAAGLAGGAAPSALSPAPHVVSVDVTRAFDHVSVPTLLAVVEPLLGSEHYLVLKYCEVAPSLGTVRVIQRRSAIAGGPTEVDFPSKAAQLAAGGKGRVFTDQVVYQRVARAQALRLLRQHLQANLVRLRRQWHYQTRGIAQGCTLSTLLCCLYLAHVERTCINPIIASGGALGSGGGGGGGGGPYSSDATGSRGRLTALAEALDGSASHGQLAHSPYPAPPQASLAPLPPAAPPGAFAQSLLMRIVDDWLLVTPSAAVAQAVARAVIAGFPEFDVAVNPEKTKLSFALALPGGGEVAPRTWDGGGGRRFVKWCGLLVNVATLEVQGDYTRYVGEHISASLTLPLGRTPGAALARKLCHYLRPKVHPLLLDPALNSPDTVRLNVYQAFLLAAMKLHCFVRAMPARPAPGSNLMMAAIESGVAFMATLARPRAVAPMLRPECAVRCATVIGRRAIRYLGLHAFHRVLRRKQAAYGGVLRQLEAALREPACARCAPHLAGAVDPERSRVFEAILY